ncbi:MAG: hypothetical protein K0R28_2961 [Paenibacillus sp.]|nr:hypothetical protein [Paenibacillus sp.]
MKRIVNSGIAERFSFILHSNTRTKVNSIRQFRYCRTRGPARRRRHRLRRPSVRAAEPLFIQTGANPRQADRHSRRQGGRLSPNPVGHRQDTGRERVVQNAGRRVPRGNAQSGVPERPSRHFPAKGNGAADAAVFAEFAQSGYFVLAGFRVRERNGEEAAAPRDWKKSRLRSGTRCKVRGKTSPYPRPAAGSAISISERGVPPTASRSSSSYALSSTRRENRGTVSLRKWRSVGSMRPNPRTVIKLTAIWPIASSTATSIRTIPSSIFKRSSIRGTCSPAG